MVIANPAAGAQAQDHLAMQAARGREIDVRSINLLEQDAAADAEDLHRTTVDRVDPFANGGVQIRQGEKGAVSQRRETHRCAIWTLTSTLGLSVGVATRAGITRAS
jgi:hypothetical protein